MHFSIFSFSIFSFIFIGCYTPIGHFAYLETTSSLSQSKEEKDVLPFIFYKECSKNGSAWLYECQNVGLMSIQQAVALHQKDLESLQDIQMFFSPQKNYIRFEVYDKRIIYQNKDKIL